jgi:hypothetical protein
MKTGLEVCFVEKSVDSKLYMDMYTGYVKFTPYAFAKNTKTEPWNEKKHLKSMEKAKAGDRISIYDLNQNILSIGSTGSKVPFTSLCLVQNSELFLPTNEEVEQIIKERNYVSAYLYDAQYVEVQSTYYINNLKHKKIPDYLYETIKDTPTQPDTLGDIKYDIRYNPGRQDLISYTWLIAAWKMWFGQSFFELVPKEKILGFKDAYDIKELPNGDVFVQLFEKLEDSYKIKNMRLQQLWRDSMGYHDLISKYS